jgi:hypothetical protein
MPGYNDGYIIWKGDLGRPDDQTAVSRIIKRHVEFVSPDLEFDNFRDYLAAHSLCDWINQISVYTEHRPEVPPGVGANVDDKVRVYYRDPSSLKTYCFSYPSPIAADVESTPTGDRLKDPIVVAVVNHLSLVADETYTPLYGVITQNR